MRDPKAWPSPSYLYELIIKWSIFILKNIILYIFTIYVFSFTSFPILAELGNMSPNFAKTHITTVALCE